MIDFTVVNSTCTVTFDCAFPIFPLDKIARVTFNSVYQPSRFSALRMKYRKPKGTVLLFANRKANIVGCRRIEDAKVISKKCSNLLSKLLRCRVKVSSFSCSNVVVSGKLAFSIDLMELSHKLGPNALYEPELYSGLRFQDGCTIMMFRNGSVYCTGLSDEDELNLLFQLHILPHLSNNNNNKN